MRHWMDPLGMLLVAAVALSAAAGCPRASSPRSEAESPRAEVEPGLEESLPPPDDSTVAIRPTAGSTPELPPVVMSDEHFEKLLFQPGEVFPDVTLLDAFGREQRLGDLFSPTATLVLVWDLDAPYAKEQFLNLRLDGYEELAPELSVVTINFDDEPALLRSLIAERMIEFPVLLAAPNSQVMSLPETPHLPQVFLLDGDGVVAWCDLEYSLHSRRKLDQAVRNLLSRRIQTAGARLDAAAR